MGLTFVKKVAQKTSLKTPFSEIYFEKLRAGFARCYGSLTEKNELIHFIPTKSHN